jgi:molecular chaperone GrpE
MRKAVPQTEKANNAEAPGPQAPSDPALVAPDQLEALKARAAKADEHWDRLLRTAADFENFKKRAARERQEAIRFANESLIGKLLPVLDHLDQAMQAATQAGAGDGAPALQTGVAMTLQQLKKILQEAGLEEIDARGQQFDPNWHEAVSQQDSRDVPEGQVIQQLRKGYKLRDRLLRPAAVVVARKPGAPASPEPPPAA